MGNLESPKKSTEAGVTFFSRFDLRTVLLTLIFAGLSSGCASTDPLRGEAASGVTPKSEQDERITRNRAQQLKAQTQAEKRLVTEAIRRAGPRQVTRREGAKTNGFRSGQGISGRGISELPPVDPLLHRQNTGRISFASNEDAAFAELLEAFYGNDVKEFPLRYRYFVDRFPQSGRLEEAAYYNGLFELEALRFGNALKEFNAILNRKTSQAEKQKPKVLFAKAVALKRMQLREAAKSTLKDLVLRYKSSPESIRAQAELLSFQ